MKRLIATHVLAFVIGVTGGVLPIVYFDNQIFSMYQEKFHECIEIATEYRTRLQQTERMIDACIDQNSESIVELDQCTRQLKQCVKVEFEFTPNKKKVK